MSSLYHINQRLSLKSQQCTTRYIGSVSGKPGTWLGVEWDDPTRGKHNGSHEGIRYFTCRSHSSACASFVRSNQPWDESKTFMQALRDKYVSNTDSSNETIYFSSKQAEEVGFDKFARRQAQLQGIHVLVLDRMFIRHFPNDADVDSIEDVCAEITELNISGNLFETIVEIADLCRRLPKLRTLTLDANRFVVDENFLDGDKHSAFTEVLELSLSSTLLDWKNEVQPMLRQHFTNLRSLSFENNECSQIVSLTTSLPVSLLTVDLSHNNFESMENLSGLANTGVQTLILKYNNISTMGSCSTFPSIKELDIRHNAISSFSFVDTLRSTFPALRHLRMTGYGLYASLTSPEGKVLTAEDGYMLTIARLPLLETLNYSKITDKERLNAETYYLNMIALELSRAASTSDAMAIKRRHPRWQELCDEYGEPAAAQKGVAPGSSDSVDPNSLAARLITITFSSDAMTWTQEVPRSFSTYEVLGMVGKTMKVPPLKLQLLYQTGEREFVVQGQEYAGPEWWCSDSESENGLDRNGDDGLVLKEVELKAGTRTLGTYIEGADANIMVVIKVH